jgi:PAS domain S-box-containing protein
VRGHLHPELQAAKYVVFVDDSGRYTDCSDEASELVGYNRTELLHLKIDDLSFDKSLVPLLFEKYKRDGIQKGEYILRRKNGAPLLIRYNAWVFDDGCHAAAWEPAEEWEQLFFSTLIETDPILLRDKIHAALHAIQKRQLTIDAVKSPDIRQKLSDASEALRSLLLYN